MDNISIISLLVFIVITIFYFKFRPQLTLSDLINEESNIQFYSKKMKSVLFYLGVVVFFQLILNVWYLINKCGGSLDKNIASAAIFTFIPWILIFGVMLAVLLMFPGFKSAFADVIGYYVVAGGANDIFGQILLGTDLNEMIEQTTDIAKKTELTKAAEAIVKICGNKSILINQINPDNFIDIWQTLKPLMTPGSFDNYELKQQLLDLVLLKDNIGEAFWYVYTAILISSIVYYNLATRGCVKSVNQMKSDHDAYVKEQESQAEKSKLNNSTKYVM